MWRAIIKLFLLIFILDSDHGQLDSVHDTIRTILVLILLPYNFLHKTPFVPKTAPIESWESGLFIGTKFAFVCIMIDH